MSHKTGKRVLTASTSLALAVVGLAASPLAAHAASVGTLGFQWVNGCGTNDYIAVASVDNFTQLSIDGGATWSAITYKPGVDVNGDKMVDISGLAIYETNSASGSYHNAVKDVMLANANGTKTTTATVTGATAAHVTDSACTVSVGASASGLTPSTGTLTGAVKAPTVTPNVGSNGGTVTLTNTLGIKWTVNDGVTTQTIASADIGATNADTKTVAVTGSSVTVTASAEQATGVNLAPPSAFTWTFTLNGGVQVAAPNAPTYTASTNQASFAASSTDNYRWYVTSSSVTTPGAAASTTPLATSTAAYQFASSDAGTTKKIWAIPLQGFQFADGSTYKEWDISIPAGAGIVVDPAQFTFTDTATTDTVTVPAISGVKLYYAWKNAAADPIAPTFYVDGTINGATNGFTALPTGMTTTLTTPAAGSTLYIIATPTAPGGSFAYRAGLWNPTAASWAALTAADFPRTAAIGLKSPSAYNVGPIAQVPYPAFTDAAGGANDSVTFPDFSGEVTWDVYAYPNGTISPRDAANKLTAAAVNASMGKTLLRGSWGSLTTGTGDTTVNPNGDVTFEFVPTAATGKSLPAGLDGTRLKGTLYVAGGVVASEPVWIDNSGTTAPDFIKINQIAGVTYSYRVDADNNGQWDAAATALNGGSYTNGVAIIPVAAGSRVLVTAVGTTDPLRVNDPGQTNQITWTHQFTTGNTGVVPAAPTSSDQPGASNDTYTVPYSVGVDYYVNGAIKGAGTYSTNGASSVLITAQPQAGYTIAQGATTSWTLGFQTPNDLGDVAVGNSIITDASVPTTRFSWSAANATSYTVTYTKVLGNGTYGPELTWFANTTQTSANFVAVEGDEYIIKVTARNAAGQTKSATSGVEFPGDPKWTDVYTGVGTFNSRWLMLNNLLASQNLPYYKDTAALGYQNAEWTVTLPAGTKSLDLFATIHAAGAAGKIQVNGQNWADFTTSSNVWKSVTDPYKYPVRTIQGWNSSKPVTIKVMVTDSSDKYLALDAFKAHN